MAAAPARLASRLLPAALGLAAVWPLTLRAFVLGPARSQGRCPSLRTSTSSGGALHGSSQSQGCGTAEERQGLPALPLVLVAAVAAAATAASRRPVASRRGRPRVVRAAAEESSETSAPTTEAEATSLADRLDTQLKILRDREATLLERISAVQEKIESIEETEPQAEGEGDKGEKADVEAAESAEEGGNEAEVINMEALKEAEELAREAEKVAELAEVSVKEVMAEPATDGDTEDEQDAFKELKILQQLATTHDDITKREIAALEALAGGNRRGGVGAMSKVASSLREAGARLRERVDKEFRSMREREARLMQSIEDTAEKVKEIEKEADTESKVTMELRMLESLATAYEDTTTEEIKALQRLAKSQK